MMFIMRRSSGYGRRGRQNRPAQLSRFSAADSHLNALMERASALSSLEASLWPYLPPSIRAHCKLANFRDSTLYLTADSPLWAARVRHTSPQILHAARQRCKIPARALRVRVQWAPPRPPPRATRKPLSPAARDHLRQAATTQNDPEIAAIMRRLAERNG